MTSKNAIPSHRAGLLIPSSYTVLEKELMSNAPGGWSFHSARMFLEDSSILSLARMLDEFANIAARDLASMEPDLVVFSSMSAAALRGNEAEDALIRNLESILHVPVISPMKATRQMLKSMELDHLVVITPYVNGINQQIKACFENDGFRVMRIEGFNLTRCRDMAELSPEHIMQIARMIAKDTQPEALVICGSNVPLLNQLKSKQASMPCLVVTTNKVILEEIVRIGYKLSKPH